MKVEFDVEKAFPAFKGGEKQYDARMFFDGTNRIMQGRLVPGASIGLHTHADGCEVMFVTEGRGYVMYDGQRIDLQAGDCHYCPKGHTHTLINDGGCDLKILAVVAKQ